MSDKIEPSYGVSEALLRWIETGESVLSDLSSLFNPLSQASSGADMSAELARRLLTVSLNSQILKDFRDHSVHLLSSLQKNSKAIDKKVPLEEREESGSSLNKNLEPPEAMQTRKLTSENTLKGGLIQQRQTVGSDLVDRNAKTKNSLITSPVTQKIILEVLHSIDLLSSIPTGDKEHVQQFETAYQKIKSVMHTFIKPSEKPINGEMKQPLTPPFSVKIEEKKFSSKHSVSSSTFEKVILEKVKLDNQTNQSKIIDRPSNFSTKPSPSKIDSLGREINSSTKKSAQSLTPQSADRTSLPGAPFSPLILLPGLPRKEKKRRKSPWEREEYDESDNQDKR